MGRYDTLKRSPSDFTMLYVIGIGVVVVIGYLSGFGQGLKQFSVNCPNCDHKFSLEDPGGDCPACGVGLYIDDHGDCKQKIQR